MRTNYKHLFCLLTLSTILFGQIILAQVPQTISYQGVLTDAAGSNVPDGNYNLTFKLYDAGAGGTELWSETQSIAVSNGIYNAILGSINPLSLLFDKQYWLGVTVEEGTELSPRIQLTSSPYSLNAASISDGAVTQIKIPPGQVVKSINSLKDDVTLAAGSNVSITPSGNTLTISSSGGAGGGDITAVIAGTGLSGGGKTGDVTLNVNVPLELEGNLADPQSIIYAKNTNAGGDAIVGESQAGDGTSGISKTGNGLYGQTETGRGVYGVNNDTGNEGYLASNDYGVYGNAFFGGSGYIGSLDYGVYGQMGDVTFGYLGSADYGVYGCATELAGIGVVGKNSTVGNRGFLGSADFGVMGEFFLGANAGYNIGKLATNSYGAYGSATGLEGIGVVGKNSTFAYSGFLGSADYGVMGEYFIGANAGYNRGKLATNSYGAYGFSPTQFGVWGESNTGVGVYGKSNTNDGVYGYSKGSVGVYGVSDSSWGVIGYNIGSDNIAMLGGSNNAIRCITNNAGQRALVAVANGGSGEAAFLQGSATVTGTLYKGGGSFKIDHPLDPANKYLYHSFVESPDMMNVYNGNVSLDASGEATITLPDWFESLNRDFRYQLTCIGGFAPVYVAQEISGNTFKISGGTPGLKVSWQVTGIRHDKFAEAHRIPIEEFKEGKERGKYLHPIENGMPESYGINYEENQNIIREQIKRMEEIKKHTGGAEQNKTIRSEK